MGDVASALRALAIPVVRKGRSSPNGGRGGAGGGADESWYSAPWGRSGGRGARASDGYDELADVAEHESF